MYPIHIKYLDYFFFQFIGSSQIKHYYLVQMDKLELTDDYALNRIKISNIDIY